MGIQYQLAQSITIILGWGNYILNGSNISRLNCYPNNGVIIQQMTAIRFCSGESINGASQWVLSSAWRLLVGYGGLKNGWDKIAEMRQGFGGVGSSVRGVVYTATVQRWVREPSLAFGLFIAWIWKNPTQAHCYAWVWNFPLAQAQ